MSYMKRFLEESTPHPIYVQVWLNDRQDGLNFVRGFRADDPMRLAAEYYTDGTLLDAGQPDPVLDQTFRELNVDNPTTEWAREYRDNRNRSLSVGDVVVVSESAYACESVGWKQVALRNENCVR